MVLKGRTGIPAPEAMYALAHLGIAAGLAELSRGRGAKGPIDFRAVLVGSMLADLIDKPLGVALGIGGRTAAHTGLFAVALTVLGVAAASRGRTWPGWLAFGEWVHLALDGMWEEPWTLLYPAFGWAFPPGRVSLLDLIQTLLRDPFLWAGEAVGALLLAALAVRHGVTSWSAFRRFVTSGRVSLRP